MPVVPPRKSGALWPAISVGAQRFGPPGPGHLLCGAERLRGARNDRRKPRKRPGPAQDGGFAIIATIPYFGVVGGPLPLPRPRPHELPEAPPQGTKILKPMEPWGTQALLRN